MDKEKEIQKESNFIMLVRRSIIGAFIVLAIILSKLKLANIAWIFVVCLIFWILTSFPFGLALKKLKDEKSRENVNFLYFIFECLMLRIGIHYIGGIYWWGGIFYSITIIFAHFMLSRRKAIDLTLVAIFVFFNGLVMLEFFGIIQSVYVFGKPPQGSLAYLVATLFLTDFFIMFLAGVLGVFSDALKKKKKEVELTTNQIEEEKAVLEIKINARTKETRDFANKLEDKVHERTGDLEKKIKELKKFTSLIKGREEKLIELEKETEKLKTSLELKKGG